MGNVSHVNNFSGVGRGRGYRVPSNNGSSTYVHEGGDTYIYPTKAACREALLYKMDKYPATRDNDYDSSHNYTVDYNSWIMATGYDLITDNIRSFAKREGREAYVQYTKYARWETTEGFLEYQAVKADSNKKQAFNKVCWAMFKTIRQAITLTTLQSNQALVATVQMDNELVEKVGEQGSTNQDSDKKENTIITRDQLETRSTHENTLSSMSRITTSEPQHNFESLVDRWMPLKAFNISINDKTGSMIQAYYIPENLYKSCAPNMLPFETFIYGEINCEFRLLTNANKFHVGKVVVSSKYDSYQVDRYCGTMQCALMRNHVIVDLTANNEAVLQVPFRYHNQYIRLNSQDASKGVRSGKYCSVYVHVLSPLQTGPDGPSDVGARMYYRLKKCSFAGMTYRIPITQMDTEVVLLKGAASLAKPLVRLAASTASEIVDDLGIEDIVHNVANISLKSQIKRIEDSFDQLGSSTNQDKPGKMSATIFVPKPKLNFCTGKGVTDIIPLRVNPLAQTNMAKVNLPLDEPRNFYDLARIYGLYQSFTIKNTDGEGTTLYNRVVDPFSRSYDSTYAGNPTPFEFAQGFFAFGSGPIDFRFDFVSNAYHTMTIQISAEFGRESTSQDICQSSSTYVKVFHLGEQKSVDFRVPYIYDTPFRRDTGSICNPYLGIMRNEQILQDSISIAPESRTRIKIKVINPLRPVSTAPKSIEVLVFIRAGKNYTMHGLKPASFVMPSTKPLDNFPQHYAPSTILGIKKNDPTYFDKAVISAGRNQWNEHSEGSLPLAVVQMDNGEKEDSDPTDNFNEGKCAMLALTNDCQMNFKDLLRRPVLLINGLTYKDGDGFQGFFMPCMPPQKDMCTSRDNGDNGVLDAGIIFHSTTGIVNMFRMFRGGSRWTLIVIPLESPYEPVYVTYIPHSGVRIFGEHTLTQWKEPTGDKLRKTKMNFYSHGYLTEVMIPHVNNMMTFETPYDTELPWTLIHEDNSALNYSWRDKGNTNCGHIVINCRSKIKFDLFWSAADDFELAGFYGIDRCVNDTNQYRYSDVHGKVQMDFLNDESNTMVSGFLNKTKRLVKLSNLSRYGLALVPGIGPGLVAASAANNLKDGLESAQGDVKLVREKLEQTADKFNVTMDTFTDLLNQVVNGLSDKLSGLMNGVSCLYDMILDIFISWSTKSWVPVGVGIVRFLSKAFIGKTEVVDIVLKYGLQLANWIQDWTSSVIPVVQSVDNTSTSTLVSILVGLVGTLVGVHLDPRQHRSYMRGLGERLTSSSGISYFVSVLRFIQGIFFSLKELVMEALGYVSVEARALRTLKEKNEIIAQFIDEAQLVTSEVNTSFLGVPSYRKRFWKVVLQAYQIQKLICQLPNNVASGQLARLCTEVVKIANEKFLDLAASPVRYEPFIIFLEGEPGVGKSFVSESIAAELLKSIGYTAPASGIVYQRTSGEKFWSGYRDQAVVVYDEFLNSNDSQRCMDFIVEFQKLKSTSTFIPEMAHLEEKKIRGNPLIVMVLCNGAFPNLADYARYPSAILRRREVVLRVERAEGFESLDLRQVDRNITKQFQHLSYLKYADVQDSKSLGTVRKNHVETLDYLTKRFQNWHAIETQNVQERMRKLPAFLANQDEINLEDPFTLFYTASEQLQVEGPNQNAWTPFEYLQAAVDQLNSVVVAHQARVTSPPQIPPNPTWETLNVRTESITSNIVGFLSAAVPLSWVVNMSINQLDSLEMSMLSTTEEMTECPVCLTQTVCCYACKDTILHEVQHRVCINCTRSLRTIGDGKCPLCRCDQLLPTMDSKNLMRLSIWGRLAIKGCRGLKWFLNKIVHWYNWRTNHPLLSLIGDYLMEVVYMTYQIISMDLSDPNCIPTINSLSTGMTCGRIYSAWYPDLVEFTHTMRAYVQNEWDDFQPTPSTSNDTGEIDRLDVNINPKVLDEYVSGFCDEVVCLHYLLDKNRSLMRLNKDHFECLDEKTNKFVSVSFYQCLDPSCPLKQSGYLQRIFSTYLQHHKLSLRQLYIDYINNPCKVTRNAIPEIFRLNSMSMIDIKIEQDWWTYITESYKKYKDLLLYISGAAMIVGGVISLYSMVNNTISSTQTDGGLMSSPGDQSPRYRRVKVRDRHQVRYFQSCDTPTVIDVVRKYIVKNTVKFTLGDLTQGKVMYGIGLFKHYVLIPKHYVRVILEGISKNKILYVELEGQPQMRTIMNLKASDVTYAEDVDAAYLRVPANIPLFKDLLKFFAKDEDLDKPLCADAELMLVPGRMREYFSMVPVEIEGVEPSRIIVDTDNNTFVAKDVLVYNYSKPGACGSLLLREHHQRPILSMHFAGAGLGSDGKGYGVILTQESLKPLSDIQNDVVQFDDVEYGSIEDAQFVYDDKVALGYLGTVKPDQVPYIPAKSRLVKSLIHGKPGLEVDIEPAILSKSDPRHKHMETPLYAGVRKHGLITKNFDQSELEWARQALWDCRYSSLRPLIANPQVLTESQAICGLEVEHYKKMDLATSAGYPYILSTKKKKSDYVTLELDEQLCPIRVTEFHPQLRKHLDENREKRKLGIIPQELYVDTLKDEKRPVEKLMQASGTRVFCNGPIHKVIEDRRFFMHFVATFMSHRFDLGHSVGINPLSSEWTLLTNRLLKHNADFMTLDYSNFGPGYNAGVAEMAYNIIVQWTIDNVSKPLDYSQEEYERTLRALVWNNIQSHHICSNTVYHQVAGSPSGSFFTTIINSIVNQIYFLLAWRKLAGEKCKKQGKSIVKEFFKNVELFVYGDDAIYTVSDEYKEVFNMRTIVKLFAQYNICATSSDKEALIEESEGLSKATFLKRGFLRHPTRDEWLSPLKWKSILSATQWVWASPNLKEATYINATAALLQSHGHGKQKYNELKELINKYLRKGKMPLVSDQWEDIDELFYEGHFIDIDTYINF